MDFGEFFNVFKIIMSFVIKGFKVALWFGMGIPMALLVALWFLETVPGLNILFTPWVSPLSEWIFKGGSHMAIFFFGLSSPIWVKKGVRFIKKDFTWSDVMRFASAEKKETQGVIPSSMQLAAPLGVVFGKRKHSYICKPLEDDLHVAVLGPPGSGKSAALILPTVMKYPKDHGMFVVDIKGELEEKSGREGFVLNPTKPDTMGYDPFYFARKSKSPVEEIRQIAITLLPEDPNSRDTYWVKSAQNMLSGVLLACFEDGMGFGDSIKFIQAHTPSQLLSGVSEVGSDSAKMYLTQLLELKEETLGSIYSNMSNALMIFATSEELQRVLAAPPITPDMLEDGKTIFLQIPEHRLNQWGDFTALVIQQFMYHMEQRSDGNSKQILFVIDELARMGQIPCIENGTATLRSKHCVMMLCFQQRSQLEKIYGREGATNILGNCGWTAILGLLNSEDQRSYADLIGKFDRRKKSEGASSSLTQLQMGTNSSTTTEQRYRVEPDELAHLGDELILISPDGYSRIEKCYWFKDSALNKAVV